MKSCSFCGSSEREVKLVTCPRAQICQRCTVVGADAVDTDEGVDCTFCQAKRASFIADTAAICPECVELARQIILESAAPLPVARVVKR